MSIHTLKQELSGVPNIGSLTAMRWEDGCMVFAVHDRATATWRWLNVGPGPQLTMEEVRQALEAAMNAKGAD